MPYSPGTISRLTLGKIQLNPIENILKWDMRLLRDPGIETLFRMIREDEDFALFITRNTSKSAARLLEATDSADGRYAEGGRRRRPRFSQFRDILYNLFSANQRGGGSRICSQPLIELDPIKYTGLHATYAASKEVLYRGHAGFHGIPFDNPDRLSGFHITIGTPYAEIMSLVTEKIARAIDRVSANLSGEVRRRMDRGERIEVEELTGWCSSRLPGLMSGKAAGGRLISKVDFFLYPPARLRSAALQRGFVDKQLAAELREALQNGDYHLSVFDISGGAAGVGKSEILARHWGFETSGLLAAYADSLLRAFRRAHGLPPTQVVIMPTGTDMAYFAHMEYLPLLNLIRDRGCPAFIMTSEAYEEALSKDSRPMHMRSIDGRCFMVGGDERTLIVRRYAYLFAENGRNRGIIPRHPPGTTVLPSDESRIAASDCRVNFPILKRLETTLRDGPDGGRQRNFRIIPSLVVKPGEPRAPETAASFLASCGDAWPEVRTLGGIVKPVDKMNPSQEASFPAAYPLPPVPIGRHALDRMIRPLFENLLSKGVHETVLMPNVLPLVVDQEGSLLPKMEIRMMYIGS